MSQMIREVMSIEPVVCKATSSLADAAKAMRDRDIGDVLVEHEGQICGVVTDRDLVVRGLAGASDASSVRLGDICSHDLVTVAPDDPAELAVRLMREHAIRRLPVMEGGRAVGIVSLGDLAMERDRDSALADISAAPPSD